MHDDTKSVEKTASHFRWPRVLVTRALAYARAFPEEIRTARDEQTGRVDYIDPESSSLKEVYRGSAAWDQQPSFPGDCRRAARRDLGCGGATFKLGGLISPRVE